MPNKHYQKGYKAELAAMHQLEAEGWMVVRSSGSHGMCDLVASRWYCNQYWLLYDVLKMNLQMPYPGKRYKQWQEKWIQVKYGQFEEHGIRLEQLKAFPVPEYISKELWECLGQKKKVWQWKVTLL